MREDRTKERNFVSDTDTDWLGIINRNKKASDEIEAKLRAEIEELKLGLEPLRLQDRKRIDLLENQLGKVLDAADNLLCNYILNPGDHPLVPYQFINDLRTAMPMKKGKT